MKTVQVVITAACLLSAVWIAVLLVLNRVPDRWLLNLMLGVELLLVIHLVLGIVKVTDAPSGIAVWEYVGYLIGAILIVPAGVIWSSGERSRGGTAVLLVAVLVVPFMFVRLADIWAAGA
jgi:hypothetical protein